MIGSLASSSPATPIPRNVIKTPWYYGWNVVVVAALYQGIVWGIGMHCFTYFVSSLMGAFDVGRGKVMLAVSVAVIFIGAMAPFAGRIVDRVSMTMLVSLAVVVFAVGLLLISISTELWQIIAVYAVLLSVGMTFAGPLTATTLAVRWFRARRGVALGVVLSGAPIGSILLPYLVTALIAQGGWRSTFVYLALLCALLAPVVFFIVRGSPASAGVEIEADNPRTAAIAAEQDGKTWTMLQVLRSPAIWIIVIAFLPLSVLNLGVQSNIAPFAKDLGYSLQQAAGLIPIMGALGFAAKFFFGALADRMDPRILFFVATCCIAAGLAIMYTAPGFQLMLVACGLFAFGEGAALLLIGAIVAVRFGPAAYGTALGIVYFFVMTLGGVGPIIGGYLRDMTGSYAAMFGVMLTLLTPAFISMALLRGRSKAAGARPIAAE